MELSATKIASYSLAVIIIGCGIGNWVINSKPDPKPKFIIIAAPTPTPGIVIPNLTHIETLDGRVLANTKIKAVTDTGIIFLVNEELVKVAFTNLPTEFKAYYRPLIPKAPTPTPFRGYQQESGSQNPQSRSKSQAASAREAAQLKELIADRDAIIDRFVKQSSFKIEEQRKKGIPVREITQEEYEKARVERDEFKGQLAALARW
jgi:hypothetical protein